MSKSTRGPRPGRRARAALTTALAALAAGALAGCTSGGGGGGDADDDSVTPPPAPPSTPIRRLNRIELLNTLEDLIGPAYMGDFDEIGHRLPPDPLVGGLDTISQSLGTSATYVEQIGGLIEFIVGKIDLGMVAPGPMTDAALPALFDSFGRRALRRPLTADERASYTALYDHLAPDQGHTVAIQAVLQRMLLSPDFLYQVALGDAATGKLTDHEMASRLSYLLWETMPDAELDAAADQGALHTPEQVEAQLTRLAADPRAQATIMRFVRAWLELDGLDTIAKDPRFYPEFAGLRPAMIESFDRFLADTVATGDLATLLSSNEAYVDDGLASLYGVAGPGPGMMVRTQLPGNQRAGMMTQAAFLSVFGKADRSAPILRGVFILDRLLCAPPDPPPPGGGVIPPDLPSPTTTRDFFANLTSPPGCQTCHSIINPIGFGFEHYDAIGRWRIEENGYPIDSTGHVAVDGADTPFDGAIQLGDALAHSDTVRRCLVRRWFRSRFGRIDTADDAPIIDDLDGAFAGDSAQLRALPAILAHTDAFYRPHFQLASAP